MRDLWPVRRRASAGTVAPKGGIAVDRPRAHFPGEPAFADAHLALEIVEAYPHAILVEDVDGRLVAHNRAAARLLDGVIALDEGSEIGCLLLGCRRSGGPLADVCVHERARERHGRMPELRIDLPPGSGAGAAWVTVVAVGNGRRLVMTELRPGERRDRRRRSEPHWTAGPQLRIFAFGRTRVMSAEAMLDGQWLANRPGQILKLLVAERDRRVYSDEIVERLWPAGTHDTRGLRNFVHALREHLEPQGAPDPPSSFVLAFRGGYRLERTRVWIDADAFEQLVAAGKAAADGGEDAEALIYLHRGLELYCGEFLADEPYAEWALPERDRLRRMASDGLRLMAALQLRTGDLTAAAGSLERLADLEPYDVDVCRDLLSVLLRCGRRSEALRRYETLRRRLMSTFGERLDFSLADVMPDV
jgi:DNA-binding SARP family transcriptional activator